MNWDPLSLITLVEMPNVANIFLFRIQQLMPAEVLGTSCIIFRVRVVISHNESEEVCVVV